ncbi:response regulator transcription factor [Ktedonosporobacter rubrisoli]|uniref:Response regulator transcription factor n=1 Tax=Ktedonosporobacter rubrisoli TaxID=2509675 RepID=A0A4P6K328_KTERU|nr:response regulator transcription factor [Ktedonosporobacter rubrisoli]QBD82569.1 response regulator transcription factor [Ktedonosporobacter rubrisoli]
MAAYCQQRAQDTTLKQVVGISDVRWDIGHQRIHIGNKVFTFTRTQYRLLFPLRHGLPVMYAELACKVYQCAADDKVRIAMDKHIDKIRSKLRGSGLYVYCILGYGYILLSEASDGFNCS